MKKYKFLGFDFHLLKITNYGLNFLFVPGDKVACRDAFVCLQFFNRVMYIFKSNANKGLLAAFGIELNESATTPKVPKSRVAKLLKSINLENRFGKQAKNKLLLTFNIDEDDLNTDGQKENPEQPASDDSAERIVLRENKDIKNDK